MPVQEVPMRRRLAPVLTLVVAVAVLTSVGCASAKATDWTGHHIDEVIKEFGSPTRVVSTPDGGKMYVWELQRSVSEPSWGSGPGAPTVSSNVRRYTATKTFWVRPDGIVASWNLHD
jgi:hypothetical protein